MERKLFDSPPPSPSSPPAADRERERSEVLLLLATMMMMMNSLEVMPCVCNLSFFLYASLVSLFRERWRAPHLKRA